MTAFRVYVSSGLITPCIVPADEPNIGTSIDNENRAFGQVTAGAIDAADLTCM
jgi:hypothetical protein